MTSSYMFIISSLYLRARVKLSFLRLMLTHAEAEAEAESRCCRCRHALTSGALRLYAREGGVCVDAVCDRGVKQVLKKDC